MSYRLSVSDVIAKIRERGVFVFDLETTSLSARDGVIEGIAIYVPGKKGFKPLRVWLAFIPGTMPSDVVVLNRQETLELLREIFEDEEILAIAQNAKFDVIFVESSDNPKPIKIKNRLACSMVAAYMAKEGRRSYKLRDLADELFGIKIVTYKEAKDRQLRFGWEPTKELGEYAMDQVEATWRLFCHSINSIREQDPSGQLERLYWNLEMPVHKILMEMERTGVLIDPRPLWSLDEEIGERRKKIEDLLLDKIGWVPKLSDATDVSRLIYGHVEEGGLGLPPGNRKRNGHGNYSTKREELEVWARRNKYVALVVEWRRLKACQESYIARMLRAAEKERRIHCNFKQVRHPVGRMTCSDPFSLTDIPKKEGIRRAICSHYSGDDVSAGLAFLDLDFNQLELRVLADLSGDKRMIEVFSREDCSCSDFEKDGRCKHVDIHTLVAERLGISREKAKAINYGIIYGMGPDRLAKAADLVTKAGSLQRNKANGLIDGWYEFFADVRKFFRGVGLDARKAGWVCRAESGRLLRLGDDMARYNNKSSRSELLRKIHHFSVSAFATDLVKKAMVNIKRMRDRKARSDDRWSRVKFVLQVHDQFLIQFPKEIQEEVVDLVGKEAESIGSNLSVPVRVNMKVGENWEDLEDVGRAA